MGLVGDSDNGTFFCQLVISKLVRGSNKSPKDLGVCMAYSQLDAHLVDIQSHGVGGEDHERECAVYNCLGALESSFFLKTLQSWFIMAIKRLRRLLRVNWHDFLLSHFFLDDLRTNLKTFIELNNEIGLLAALIILNDKF